MGFKGLTNPNKVISCLPDFIKDSFLKEVGGRPNNVSEALITSFLASTFSDHAGALVIDCDSTRDVQPSVREVSVCTPNLPWGIPLVDCPGCGTNWHLSTCCTPNSEVTNSEVTVSCTRCSTQGKASYPKNTSKNTPPYCFLDRPQLRRCSRLAIYAPWPRPPSIQVDWTNVSTSSLRLPLQIPPTQSLIPAPVSPPSRRVCSSCGRLDLAIVCIEPGCSISLCCQPSEGFQWPCISIDDTNIQYRCPGHATDKATQFHIRNYTGLNSSVALHSVAIVDLLFQSDSRKCGRRKYLPTHMFKENRVFSSFELHGTEYSDDLDKLCGWIKSQNSRNVLPDIVMIAQGSLDDTYVKNVCSPLPNDATLIEKWSSCNFITLLYLMSLSHGTAYSFWFRTMVPSPPHQYSPY